jgi:hypothetical protein
VLLQLLGIGAHFALIAILYWQRLTDLGAVAIILGLLFLFNSAVDSGAIPLKHLSPADPDSNIRSPAIELLKALSFFAVGVGASIDLIKAMQMGLIPPYLSAAVIHILVVAFSPLALPVVWRASPWH